MSGTRLLGLGRRLAAPRLGLLSGLPVAPRGGFWLAGARTPLSCAAQLVCPRVRAFGSARAGEEVSGSESQATSWEGEDEDGEVEEDDHGDLGPEEWQDLHSLRSRARASLSGGGNGNGGLETGEFDVDAVPYEGEFEGEEADLSRWRLEGLDPEFDEEDPGDQNEDGEAPSGKRVRRKRRFRKHPLIEEAEAEDWPYSKTENWKVVLVGRPNVGKSTLYNRLSVNPSVGAAKRSGRSEGTRGSTPGKNRPSFHRQRLLEPWRFQSHGRAITHQSPGVTRDRRESPAQLSYLRFTLTDTAGLEEVHSYLTVAGLHDTQLVGGGAQNEELQEAILEQTERAILEADVVIFVFDARSGITPVDLHFARWLRSRRKRHAELQRQLGAGKEAGEEEETISMTPVVLVANKVEFYDDPDIQATLAESSQLGFGAPVTLSAETGDGLAGLFDALYREMRALWPRKMLEVQRREELRAKEAAELEAGNLRQLDLVIAGRPNVGKSTLLNKILGEPRAVTGDQPGVTRDAIRVPFKHPDFPNYRFALVDTAGLRGTTARKHSRYSVVDALAMGDTMRAIAYAHVIVVVIDVSLGMQKRVSLPNSRRITQEDIPQLIERVRGMITRADLEILTHATQEGRSVVLVANKWDLVPEAQRAATLVGLQGLLESVASQSRGLPIIPMSAREGFSVHALLPTVVTAFELWNKRLGTGQLNRWLGELLRYQPPPKHQGKEVKLKYISQINVRPPTFAVFCNRPADVDPKYRRFLLNALRMEFGLVGQPVRLLFRSSANPYLEQAAGAVRTASGGTFIRSEMRGGDLETSVDEHGRFSGAGEDEDEDLDQGEEGSPSAEAAAPADNAGFTRPKRPSEPRRSTQHDGSRKALLKKPKRQRGPLDDGRTRGKNDPGFRAPPRGNKSGGASPARSPSSYPAKPARR